MGSDNPIAETTRRILTDLADPQAINKAGDGWKAPAWSALEQAGLTLAWVPEDLGGSGADLADGFAVLREAGRFALAVPLAETLLAGWLLARAGIPVPNGAMTCAPARDGDRVTLAANGTLSGALRSVPFAKDAKHLALLARRDGGLAVALVEASQARIADHEGIGGDPLNAVRLEGARPVAVKDAPAGLDEQALLLMGAAVRSMQMAGALEAILDLSVAYANERVAFERPIAKFQAVQHNLARLAGETAVAIAAATSAADTIANASPSPLWGGVRGGGHPADHGSAIPPSLSLPHKGGGDDEAVFLEAASAKIRVGEAATEGAAIAHQVLGAIGFTQEHTLHRFTRRLWGWRDDFGSESVWAVKLGNLVAAKGADGLWPMLAER
ncbi:MAG: acyl-CoA dehydrogenase family protein [Hyphomicrobiaceae bacterium]|jgi:acyl-CoA dehydrogenase